MKLTIHQVHRPLGICTKCEHGIVQDGEPFCTQAGEAIRFWDHDWQCPLEKWTRESRGLGDTIAKLTKAVGIKPCGGCRKRQAALNAVVPYGPERKG